MNRIQKELEALDDQLVDALTFIHSLGTTAPSIVKLGKQIRIEARLIHAREAVQALLDTVKAQR